MALEEIGVIAMIAGFAEYVRNAERINQSTRSMSETSKASATATKGSADAASVLNNNLTSLARTAVQTAVAMYGGMAAFNAIKGAIESTVELGDAVHKLEITTGIGAETASEFIFALNHFGIGTDNAVRAIDIFEKKLKGVQDAETGVTSGGKSTVQILADIGVKATDATGQIRPMDQVILEVADRFALMRDGADKTGLAMQLFGRSGAQMIEFLNQGSAGIKELGAEAQRLGVVLNEGNVKQIHEFTLAQRDFGQAVEGIKVQIIMGLIPALTSINKAFVDHQPEIRQWATLIGEELPAGIEVFARAARTIGQNLETAFLGLDKADVATEELKKDALVLGIAFAFLAPGGALLIGLGATALAFSIMRGDVQGASAEAIQFEIAYLKAFKGILEGLDELERALFKGGPGLIGSVAGAVIDDLTMGTAFRTNLSPKLRKLGEDAGNKFFEGMGDSGAAKGADAVQKRLDELAASLPDARFKALIAAGSGVGEAMAIVYGKSGDAAAGLKGAGDAAGGAAASFDELTKAIDAAAKGIDALDPEAALLQAQIAGLTAQKDALQLSGDKAKGMEDRIKALTQALQIHTEQTAMAQSLVRAYGAALAASGVSVTEITRRTQTLADALAAIPTDKRVKILASLPYDDMNKMLAFLSVMDYAQAHGFRIPVALALNLAGPVEAINQLRQGLGGGILGKLFGDVVSRTVPGGLGSIPQVPREVAQSYENLAGATSTAGAAAASAGKEMTYLEQVLNAVKGGTISLADAERLGLTDQQVVALELEIARQKEADAAFRARIEFEKLAEVLGAAGISSEAFTLAIALRAIAAELARTGETVAQFLQKLAQSKLNDILSQISQVESAQTVEDLQLQLRLDQLTLERDRLEAGGGGGASARSIAEQHQAEQQLQNLESERAAAVRRGASEQDLRNLDIEIERVRAKAQQGTGGDDRLTAINKEIKAIQDEIKLRQDELAVLKDKIALDDRTRMHDEDRARTLGLLDAALKEQSEKVTRLNAQVFEETWAAAAAAQALNNLAAAAGAAAGATGNNPTTDQSSNDIWNSLSPADRLRLATLLQHLHDIGQLPGASAGGVVVRETVARLGEGGRKEAIIPLEGARAQQIFAQLPPGLMAREYAVAFNPALSTVHQGLTEEQARTLMHEMVDEMFYGARSTSGRTGSVLSSGIN